MSCGFCGKEVKLKAGLCPACYQRKAMRGTLEYASKPVPTACSCCGKVELLHAKGLCACCYQRLITTGTPEKKGREKAHGACTHCGKEGELHAKGLCGTCYNRQLNTGTLEKQGRVRASGACRHCSAHAELVRGLCKPCYARNLKRGTPDKIKVKQSLAPCSSCGDLSDCKVQGLCPKCYMRSIRHGHTNPTRPETWGTIESHPLYHTWAWMKRRSGKDFDAKVCDKWLSDFRVFVAEVGVRPSAEHKLRLIDPDGEYCQSNVVWVEPKISIERSLPYKEYAKAYAKEYRKNNSDAVKSSTLKSMYGITLDEYNQMWHNQFGKCAICREPETAIIKGKKIELAVDHCHTTGKVRGLLCHHCNKALGAFKDDVCSLESAVQYLKGGGSHG